MFEGVKVKIRPFTSGICRNGKEIINLSTTRQEAIQKVVPPRTTA